MASRAAIVQANPDMKPTEVVKVIGEEWKSLDDQSKAKFIKLADEDKIRYNTEIEAFIKAGGEIKKKKRGTKPTAPVVEETPQKMGKVKISRSLVKLKKSRKSAIVDIKSEEMEDSQRADISIAAGEYLEGIAEATIENWKHNPSSPKNSKRKQEENDHDTESELCHDTSLLSLRMDKDYSAKKPKIAQLTQIEWLKFVASWGNDQDQLVLPTDGQHDFGCQLMKLKFQVRFGIRAKDNNVYEFTLSLFSHNQDPVKIWTQNDGGDCSMNIDVGYFLMLWSEDRQIFVDPVIQINGKIVKKYGESKGHLFFKIDEGLENSNESEEMEEAENLDRDWSEINGHKCNIEIHMQIGSSNQKI